MNIDKCGCFHKSLNKHKITYDDPTLQIYNNKIPFLTPEDSFRYLGSSLKIKNAGLIYNKGITNIIEDTKEKINKISSLQQLHPAYKLEILKKYVLPCLEFILRNEDLL